MKIGVDTGRKRRYLKFTHLKKAKIFAFEIIKYIKNKLALHNKAPSRFL